MYNKSRFAFDEQIPVLDHIDCMTEGNRHWADGLDDIRQRLLDIKVALGEAGGDRAKDDAIRRTVCLALDGLAQQIKADATALHEDVGNLVQDREDILNEQRANVEADKADELYRPHLKKEADKQDALWLSRYWGGDRDELSSVEVQRAEWERAAEEYKQGMDISGDEL